MSPYRGYALVALGLTALLSAGILVSVSDSLPLYLVLLGAANLTAWLMVAWDKAIAAKAAEEGSRLIRVPEAIFFWLAIVGGSAGLLLGMKLFRHKTKKSNFQVGLVAILGLQAMAIIALTRFLAE